VSYDLILNFTNQKSSPAMFLGKATIRFNLKESVTVEEL
jgi:hypothetical protein